MDLFFMLVLDLFIGWIDQFPPVVSKWITLLLLLVFGGFAGMFGYGTIVGLLRADFVFACITFAVFALFTCVTLYFLQLFLHIGKNKELSFNRLMNVAMVILGLIFFIGFFGMLLYAQVTDRGEKLPLWREIGIFLLAFFGICGCILRLKQLRIFKG